MAAGDGGAEPYEALFGECPILWKVDEKLEKLKSNPAKVIWGLEGQEYDEARAKATVALAIRDHRGHLNPRFGPYCMRDALDEERKLSDKYGIGFDERGAASIVRKAYGMSARLELASAEAACKYGDAAFSRDFAWMIEDARGAGPLAEATMFLRSLPLLPTYAMYKLGFAGTEGGEAAWRELGKLKETLARYRGDVAPGEINACISDAKNSASKAGPKTELATAVCAALLDGAISWESRANLR